MTTHRRARWIFVVVLAALVAVVIPLGPVLWEQVWWKWDVRWSFNNPSTEPDGHWIRTETRVGRFSNMQPLGKSTYISTQHNCVEMTIEDEHQSVTTGYHANGEVWWQQGHDSTDDSQTWALSAPWPHALPLTKEQVLRKMQTFWPDAIAHGEAPPEAEQP